MVLLATDRTLLGSGARPDQVPTAVQQGVGGALLDRQELRVLAIQPAGHMVAVELDGLVRALHDVGGHRSEDPRREAFHVAFEAGRPTIAAGPGLDRVVGDLDRAEVFLSPLAQVLRGSGGVLTVDVCPQLVGAFPHLRWMRVMQRWHQALSALPARGITALAGKGAVAPAQARTRALGDADVRLREPLWSSSLTREGTVAVVSSHSIGHQHSDDDRLVRHDSIPQLR